MSALVYSIRDIDLGDINIGYGTMGNCIINAKEGQLITVDLIQPDGTYKVEEIFNYQGNHIISKFAMDASGIDTVQEILDRRASANCKTEYEVTIPRFDVTLRRDDLKHLKNLDDVYFDVHMVIPDWGTELISDGHQAVLKIEQKET